VARYNTDGLDGLQDRPGRGRKLPLDEQQTERLKKHLDEGPDESAGVCVLTGPVIRQLIEQKFNKTLTLSTTYYLLHAIGYSWLVPRPRHPQADPQKQAAFKKGIPRKAR
jgi:transposase